MFQDEDSDDENESEDNLDIPIPYKIFDGLGLRFVYGEIFSATRFNCKDHRGAYVILILLSL